MESFELVQSHLEMSGIAISQKSPKDHPFNVKNSTIFILVCLYSILNASSLHEASSFVECTDILLTSVSMGTLAVVYEIIVFKTSKLFDFINDSADIVGEREY